MNNVENVIEIEDLCRRYGSLEAVSHLNLKVPAGSVYAFLGTNGAGKTTTIDTLLNLARADSGSARVLGVPTTQIGPKELAQIAYLSQDQKMPEQLTVQELISYSRAIYPTWDDGLCDKLCQLLSLPRRQKISQFSRGMKVKAALLVSLAYRPRLFILDEPFSGLDQLIRDELIQSILELFSEQAWTMFISSHDIDDVERLADWVGIIDGGKLHISESVESLRQRYRRVDVMVAEGQTVPARLESLDVMLPEASGATARWVEPHFTSEEDIAVLVRGVFPPDTRVAVTPLSLRDIFVAVTRSLRLNPQKSV